MDCFLATEALSVWSFKLFVQCSDLQCLTLNHVLDDYGRYRPIVALTEVCNLLRSKFHLLTPNSDHQFFI